MTLDEILAAVKKFDCPLVEVTGGEPLLQPAAPTLMARLLEKGYCVLLETAGHRDISTVDPRVVRIMDLKCPDSGMSEKTRWENIPLLTANDEVKCVIASRTDYEWAREQVRRHDLSNKVRAVLFSAVFGKIEPRQIVEWILADNLPVRFQLQMHKFIWKPEQRGV